MKVLIGVFYFVIVIFTYCFIRKQNDFDDEGFVDLFCAFCWPVILIIIVLHYVLVGLDWLTKRAVGWKDEEEL